jgi:hypothetical protein
MFAMKLLPPVRLVFVNLALLSPSLAVAQSFGSQQIINKPDPNIYTEPPEGDLDAPTALAAADLDQDGDLDVVAVSKQGGQLAWYPNQGQGRFGEQRVIYSKLGRASDLRTPDVNGDGAPDLIVATNGDLAPSNLAPNVLYFENRGRGGFKERAVVTRKARNTGAIAVGDFNDNGQLAVLAADYIDGKIHRYEYTGDGFGRHQVIGHQSKGAVQFLTPDLNGDGDPDLLSISQHRKKVAWYENIQEGFGPQQVIGKLAYDPASMAAGDFDGDGDTDVLVAGQRKPRVARFENKAAGEFAQLKPFAVSLPRAGEGGARSQARGGTVGGSPPLKGFGSMQAADLDGDGRAGLLLGSGASYYVLRLPAQAGFAFDQAEVVTQQTQLRVQLALADLNADGALDLLTASLRDDKLAWYPGKAAD